MPASDHGNPPCLMPVSIASPVHMHLSLQSADLKAIRSPLVLLLSGDVDASQELEEARRRAAQLAAEEVHPETPPETQTDKPKTRESIFDRSRYVTWILAWLL